MFEATLFTILIVPASPIPLLNPSATSSAKQLTRVSGLTKPTIANRIGDAVGGGAKDMYTGMKAGKGFGEAAQLAFTHNDKIRMDRVAGTFVGASAAARVATGGGLYKDRYGNGNLIGVPFI